MDEDYEAQLLSSDFPEASLLNDALRPTRMEVDSQNDYRTPIQESIDADMSSNQRSSPPEDSRNIPCDYRDSGTDASIPSVGNKQVQTVMTMGNETNITVESQLDSCSMTDPSTGISIGVQTALDQGLIDGVSVLDTQTGRTIPLQSAVRQRMIDPELEQMLNKNSGLIDPQTGREMTIGEAINKGYINSKTKEVTDPRTGELMSLQQACANGLLNSECGELLSDKAIKATSTSQSRGYYGMANTRDTNICWTLSEAVQKGLINPHTGKFIDPISKEEMSIQEAIDKRLLDGSAKDIVHPVTGM